MQQFNLMTGRKVLLTTLLVAGLGGGSALSLAETNVPPAPPGLMNAPVAAGLPELTGLIKANSPAVVSISVDGKADDQGGMPEGFDELPEELQQFFHRFPRGPRGGGRSTQAFGSGFIISTDGYIVTNAHVVDNAKTVTVLLTDKRELEAEIVGSDKLSDVALLRVKADNLPIVQLGDSDRLDVGQWVVAIGAPFGLDHTATQGIVSALSRSLPTENYVPFIQTDAAVNPGNSGGPLFNLQGQVIGVNSQIYSRSGGYMGVSFAIPVNVVKNVVDQLKTSGQVSRGWLGVEIQSVDNKLAQSLSLPQAKGALVASVLPDSPADKAGIQAGDVITTFNSMGVESANTLPLLVGNTAIGKSVPVEVWRVGKALVINTTIEKLPGKESTTTADSKTTKGALGVAVAELTQAERDKNSALKEQGVVVREVQPDSSATEAGIEVGDIILSVDNTAIKDSATLRDIVGKASKDKPLAVLILRDDRTRFIAVTIKK
ncbi:DegQ family serine endoprotease [Thiofilum flexile]|uniref:DegQ family serine endoprotease n=1 Tax=Thiofilum flexile TaxID=125627 RepID=UPI0003613B87|nr:DegQ family serine endoprotease [Thiofilum flexile]